jgi:hypothetical protein
VLGAAASQSWLGLVVVIAVVLEHLRTAPEPHKELRLVGIAVLVGVVWESALVATNVLTYSDGILIAGFAPYWIVAMWALFATTFNVGMRWLKRHWLIAALAGAVGGPLSFYAGANLGAVALNSELALLTIGIGWAALLPLMVGLSDRLDGHPIAQLEGA